MHRAGLYLAWDQKPCKIRRYRANKAKALNSQPYLLPLFIYLHLTWRTASDIHILKQRSLNPTDVLLFVYPWFVFIISIRNTYKTCNCYSAPVHADHFLRLHYTSSVLFEWVDSLIRIFYSEQWEPTCSSHKQRFVWKYHDCLVDNRSALCIHDSTYTKGITTAIEKHSLKLKKSAFIGEVSRLIEKIRIPIYVVH